MIKQKSLGQKSDIAEFFGFVRLCEQDKLISKGDIIYIFLELFENSSRSQLEPNFEIFMEQINKYGLKDKNEGDSQQLLNIDFFCTRMCKSIMNRLSSSRDIEFKGKIQSFLSSVLPLTHKSGLNVSGRFNVLKINQAVDNVEGASAQEANLFRNFWSLQKVLANPH